MNLVIHQLRKDVRRTRVLLILWLALVVLQFALIGWTAKPGDLVMQSVLPMLSGLLAFFTYVVVMVIVPILVYQEPLVGTTAFWFTRPIARGSLLTSKSLFALFLLVLPIVVQSIAFLANGVTAHDVGLAAPQLLLGELWWILIVATLAVLTPSFGRFAIVAAIALVVFYLAYFVVEMVFVLRNPQAFLATSASLTASRGLVSSLVMMGFGLAVVLVQYLARRFALAVSLAIAGVIAAMAVDYYWPWNFMKPVEPLVQDATLKPGLQVKPVLDSVNTFDQTAIRGGTPIKQVSGAISFREIPRGYVTTIDSIDSTLKRDGHVVPVDPVGQGVMGSGMADPDAIERGLGGVPVLNMSDYGRPDDQLFTMDATRYDHYASTPLDYSARVDGTVYKYVIALELPLTKGARFDRGSEHLVITDVLDDPNGVTIALRHKDVRLEFAPRGRDTSAYAQNSSGPVYLLVNKKRREAVVQKRNESLNFSGVDNEMLINEPLQIPFGPEENNGRTWLAPSLNKAWLADAVLVRLDLAPVLRFATRLEIPGFRLDGKFKNQGSPSNSRVADIDTLDAIKLPPDATPEQVRDYVDAILVASRRVSEDEHDPQIGMLEKVGTQNVDLLVQIARQDDNDYLNRAINRLAEPGDKTVIVEALTDDHDLIDTVNDHGWQADAKLVLLKALANKTAASSYFPEGWYVALASLKDPSTYDTLKAQYIADPDKDLFRALQTLPNFDLAGTVDLAWKSAQATGSWKVREVIDAAAQFGEPDVLDVAVKLLKSSDDDYARQRARKILRTYTPAAGTNDAQLVTWVEMNRSRFVFDPNAKKFVLKNSSTPPPPKSGP